MTDKKNIYIYLFLFFLSERTGKKTKKVFGQVSISFSITTVDGLGSAGADGKSDAAAVRLTEDGRQRTAVAGRLEEKEISGDGEKKTCWSLLLPFFFSLQPGPRVSAPGTK